MLIINSEKHYYIIAEERKNVLAIAQSYGYKPKLATPSLVQLTVSVEVPAKVVGTGAKCIKQT